MQFINYQFVLQFLTHHKFGPNWYACLDFLPPLKLPEHYLPVIKLVGFARNGIIHVYIYIHIYIYRKIDCRIFFKLNVIRNGIMYISYIYIYREIDCYMFFQIERNLSVLIILLVFWNTWIWIPFAVIIKQHKKKMNLSAQENIYSYDK